MKSFVPLTICMVLIVAGCGEKEETFCNPGNQTIKSCIIDKIVYPDQEVDFVYNDKNWLVGMVQGDESFTIEYTSAGQLKKVTMVAGEELSREYRYKHFPLRTEIRVVNPTGDYEEQRVILHKNVCGQIEKLQSYSLQGTVLEFETTYEWSDGNLSDFSPQQGSCPKIVYTYDNNPNPFSFLTEILVNPRLSSRNNLILSEGGCFSDIPIDITYQPNGYPQTIDPHTLSYLFGIAMNATIVYAECSPQ